ncbi:MAG: ShlB/FhaC/HecB family hemolysin secretion/activation protein [Candidatus Omnitrophota bacterium]
MKRNLLLVIILCFWVSIVFAAEPPGASPGAQAERFQQESLQKKKLLEKKPIKAPAIEVEEKPAQPQAEGIKFVLKGVKISGAVLFKPEELRLTYESYLGKEVSFSDLAKITETVKSKYKAKGYLTTAVFLPEQDIKEGVIEIKVVEGKMGKLTIEGGKWFSSELIEKYFHLKKNEIINVNGLQRDILRLNQNSDLEVKTIISPGQEPETSDIVLKVQDRFPWHAGIGQDNQGTRLSGRYRSSLSFRSTNATGNLDSLFLNSLYSGKTFGQSLSYSLPVGTYGTKLGVDMTYFTMRLGKEFKTAEITGNTQIYTPRVSWELALTEDFQANTEIGMDIKSIKKKTGGEVISNDQLRIPYFGFNFSKIDSFNGQTTFVPRFAFSTSRFLGASKRNHPTSSRQGTGGFFFKYNQDITRIQRMPLTSYMLLRSQFQLATHTLPSSEQIQLGGANSIRGYPEGEYLADWGGSMSLDWVFPMYFIPKGWKLKNADLPLRNQIEPVFFVDIGGGQLKKVIPGEQHSKFLAGIGGGLRFRFNRNISCRLDWAGSIGNNPSSGSGPSTFYFTFQSEV